MLCDSTNSPTFWSSVKPYTWCARAAGVRRCRLGVGARDEAQRGARTPLPIDTTRMTEEEYMQ